MTLLNDVSVIAGISGSTDSGVDLAGDGFIFFGGKYWTETACSQPQQTNKPGMEPFRRQREAPGTADVCFDS